MRLLSAILLFAVSAQGATNIQHIQTYSAGTNFAAGAIGPGAWADNGPVDWIRVETNHPYKLPGWMTIGGTNYDAVSTNWVAWGSNGLGTQLRQQLTLPSVNWGPQSNMWVAFYFRTTMNNTGADCNLDIMEFDGQFSGFSVIQHAVRNGANYIYAHCGGGTNGGSISIESNKLYWITAEVNLSAGNFHVRIYDPTNNFSPLTNNIGETQSVGSLTIGTNTGRFWLQSGYLMAGQVTGTNYFSSLFFGWGNDARAPMPNTNAIVSDRTAPWTVGVNIGVRGTRPNRTLVTNVTAFGASTSSDDNTTAFNDAFSNVDSNWVVLADQLYKVRGTVVQSKDGVTFRGTNGGGILLGSGGSFRRGPTGLTAGQAKIFWPTNGIAKGATNATLTTNYSALGSAGFIAPLQAYSLSQLDGRDPQQRRQANSGAERSTSVQDIYIVATNGNTITFWPPAIMDFTNTPAMVQTFTTVRLAMGMENVTITTSNALTGEYETNGATRNMLWNGEVDGWTTGCSFLYGNQYAVEPNNLINCDFNSNIVRWPSPRSGSHGGIQITGGSLYLYDNIIADHPDRSIQLFGGFTGALVGNYFTNESGQGTRYHAPGNNLILLEGNICDDCYYLLGDGYFGANEETTALRNEGTQFAAKRFNQGHTVVGNVVDAAMETGYPNPGNLTTNGLSKYEGPFAAQTLVSGWRWNELSTNFTGSFGVSPYVGASYTNISFTFTDVATQVAQGTNILGDFSHWPYSASGGYAIIFWDGTRYWRYADFTNSPTEQISVDLRAWIQPSNGVMVLNRYMPISNGWTMYITGPDLYQQRQTIDNETYQVTHNSIGGTLTSDPRFLVTPPSSIAYPSGGPSWAQTNDFRWPWIQPESSVKTTNNPAKSRYLVLLEGGGGGAEGGTGLPSATVTGRVTLTGRARIQ